MKTTKVVLLSRILTNSHQEQNISLFSIIYSKALYKRKWFIYDILIQDNKQRKFSPSHRTKHFSSISKNNDLDGDFKRWNLLFDTTESYNTNNSSNSQLIWLKWQFVFWNSSWKVLVSLKVDIHILTVFITWTYSCQPVQSDLS